jgi:hypothetical protein
MSRVDKIVAQFTKTVSKLNVEAGRLDALAINRREESRIAALDAEKADYESARADRIAKNLEALINE